MRVIAGVAGGRRLQSVPGNRVRPTSERVREAMFNSLGSQDLLAGARMLDLFAGTGALGLEALSRGASHVTFVENDRRAAEIIRTNLQSIGIAGGRVVVDDALRFARANTELFDVAMCDPPYDFTSWTDLLHVVPADVVVAESGDPVEFGHGWELLRSKRYGRAYVSVARRFDYLDGLVNPHSTTT
jgi:16S rRNA (guanine966-N2)-methyltransferase